MGIFVRLPAQCGLHHMPAYDVSVPLLQDRWNSIEKGTSDLHRRRSISASDEETHALCMPARVKQQSNI